jgi:hypothetical protein
MLRFSARGPDLAWAVEMDRRVRHSLRLLTQYIEDAPEWREVPAFHGDARFTSRLGTRQICRVTGRYGFELVEPEAGRSLLGRLQALGDSFGTWALTRAFNPAAAPRQPFLRDHHQLWLPRATLLQRYGRASRPTSARRSRRMA